MLLDGTVVNVALPTIERDLGGGLAGQQWVVNAYLLTLGSLLLVGGSLGDLYGERRVFALGVAGFGVVSLLCALAPSIEVLVAGRALQGLFGALLVPSALAVIVATFPEDERAGAIGSWTAWSGIATLIGPLAGGQLVDTAGWRWIFGLNVPFVAAALWLILVAIPGRPERSARRRVDVLGAGLGAAGLAGPTYALIEQPAAGWGSPRVIVPLGAGLVVFAAFLAWERRAPAPMLPLGIFRRRNFSVGNLQTLVMYAGLSVTMFFLVLFLQGVAGYSALESGLALLPVTVLMFLLSKRFGALADRYGPRLPMALGPVVFGAGMLLMLGAGAEADYTRDLLPGVLLFGLGLAVTVAPLTAAVLAGVEQENAGIASGVNNAIARVAGMLGTAAVGVLVAAQFSATLDDRLAERPLSPAARAAIEEVRSQPFASAPTDGLATADARAVTAAVQDASTAAFRLALAVAAGLVFAGGLVAAVVIQDPARRVRAEGCPGGQLTGAPPDAAGCHEDGPSGVGSPGAPALAGAGDGGARG